MSVVRRSSVAVAAALVLASIAGATTYQMVPDGALVDQAAVVADVRVVSVAPAPSGPPATDYLVEVSRLLKGSLSGSTILVRVPGGMGAGGIGLRIWGAPEFSDGEQALLFLLPHADGSYGVLHLMLGAFHRSGSLAIRNLDDAQELTAHGLQAGHESVARDYARFAAWIADRGAGQTRPADYVRTAAAGELQQAIDRFTFLKANDNNGIRWFVFDQGGHVEWRVGQGGQPGLSEADTITAFQNGLNAWNSDAGSNVDYRYVGTTSSTSGLQTSDGTNAIIFGDPNHEVDGTFDCNSGGVIAEGGPWFTDATTTFHGKSYHQAGEGDIVVNDGTQCLFQNNISVASEVFGHELGHTLGLGHSCGDSSSPFCFGSANQVLNQALMRATIHNDGRGARLNSDDQTGIDTLYGNGAPPATRVPTSPARLVATATSSTTVQLTWQDRSSNEVKFYIEEKFGSGRFKVVAFAAANATTATISGLTPGTPYWFRVRAWNAKGYSGYSNVANVTTPH